MMNGIENDYTNSEDDQAIIEKYDAGRCETNEILSWEDPALEVYHVTDRYGFIHDHRLPEKLTVHETKIRDRENERIGKWLKMIKKWEKYTNSEKLKQRVYKGIPNAVRGEIWCRLLGVPQIKLEQEGKYQEMVQQSRLYSTDIKQIDLDVNRTFRNNIMFRERYGPKQQSLFQVLAAYSIYNAEVGYCQGMSQIAGLLLMFMNDEDTFWALSVLMTDRKHAMHGFFIPGFPKLKRFQEHHDKLLSKYLSKLIKHMDKFNIHSSLYTLKWFFQCFLDRVPFTLTLRLWDAYIFEGEVILTAMSFTLLKLHRKTLLKMDMDELIEFLQIKLEQDFGYNDDVAMEALQATIVDLHKHKLHLPGVAPPEELPQKPFGLIVRPESTNTRRTLSNGSQSNASFGSSVIIGRIATDSPISRGDHDIKSLDVKTTPKPLIRDISTSEASSNLFDDHSLSTSNMSSPSSASAGFPLQRAISLYDNVDADEIVQAVSRQPSGMNSPDSIQTISNRSPLPSNFNSPDRLPPGANSPDRNPLSSGVNSPLKASGDKSPDDQQDSFDPNRSPTPVNCADSPYDTQTPTSSRVQTPIEAQGPFTQTPTPSRVHTPDGICSQPNSPSRLNSPDSIHASFNSSPVSSPDRFRPINNHQLYSSPLKSPELIQKITHKQSSSSSSLMKSPDAICLYVPYEEPQNQHSKRISPVNGGISIPASEQKTF